MAWMPPLQILLSPITADTGAMIEQVQLKPLFYAAQKDALARAGDDEDDQFFELAKLATGLSEKELDQLKRPDYVSIAQYVHEMSTRPASFFLKEQDVTTHDQPVHLLLPLEAAGRTLTELPLEMPALRATKVMKKLATNKERAEFITAHCTGLMIPDLAGLTVPDWTELQERIDQPYLPVRQMLDLQAGIGQCQGQTRRTPRGHLKRARQRLGDRFETGLHSCHLKCALSHHAVLGNG